MMASGFKPVGWVAAVATAAIGCYMLSLNVASERADLLKIERQIIAAKQDIRSLQTELGTRGRLAQIEQWNADVLALSAPIPTQFLDNEIKLARFDQRAPTLDERADLRLASASVQPEPTKKIEAPMVQASVPVLPVPGAPRASLLRQASLSVGGSKLPAMPDAPAVPAVATKLSKVPETRGAKQAKPELPIARAKTQKPMTMATAIPPKAIKASPKALTAIRKPARPAGIDSSLAKEINAAAKLEAGRKGR